MIVWIDAQLSPALAPWITETFGVEAISVKRLGLRDARDKEIFDAAREASAVIMTKDVDLVMLLERFGAPPSVIWLRCGNTSNDRLRLLLGTLFPRAVALIESGEALVEIGDSAR